MKDGAKNGQVILQPWVGENYESESNEFSGTRLLVLGESHYGDAHSEVNLDKEWASYKRIHGERQFTSFVVREWGQRKSSRYFTVVANVLLNSSGLRTVQKAEIWNHVVFYNYVSTILPWNLNEFRPRRPQDQQWRDSKHSFIKVLKKNKPDAVLMLGKELTGWVSENHKHKDHQQLFVPYKHNNVIYLGIKHPSGGLSYRTANPAFQQLLEEAGCRS